MIHCLLPCLAQQSWEPCNQLCKWRKQYALLMPTIESTCCITIYPCSNIQHKQIIPFYMFAFVLVSKVWRRWVRVILFLLYITMIFCIKLGVGYNRGSRVPSNKPWELYHMYRCIYNQHPFISKETLHIYTHWASGSYHSLARSMIYNSVLGT